MVLIAEILRADDRLLTIFKPVAHMGPIPSLPNIADDLSLRNMLSFVDCAFGHVQVLRFVGAVVTDFDVISIA